MYRNHQVYIERAINGPSGWVGKVWKPATGRRRGFWTSSAVHASYAEALAAVNRAIDLIESGY